jgi:glycolate oxidase
VVVGATLRLLPRPAATATVSAYFEDVEAAADAVSRLRRQRVRPAIAELLDAATLAAVDAAQGTDFSTRGGALLLVQTDGSGAGAEADLVLGAVKPTAADVAITEDPVESADLLRARRLALPSLERLGRVLIEDIAVPRSRLAEAVRAVAAIAERHGVRVATLAHAADGNVHPIFVLDEAAPDDDAPVPEPVWAAAAEVFRTALRLGGTLTGEHGVGLLKRQWVAEELGEPSLAVHRQIKHTLDPRGILNPGKAL